MRVFVTAAITFTICLASVQAGAQTSSVNAKATDSDSHAADLLAIRQSAIDFESAFNRGNAKLVAALWTKNGAYVDDSGSIFTGRDKIRQTYKEFFATNKEQRIKIVIDDLRLLSDSAAIEEGHAILKPAPPGAPAISRYTAVHVKVDGKWLMAEVRDDRTELPSAFRHLADLDWLIGSWTAEEHGSQLAYQFQWVANKSFVERTYTVTRHDQTTSSGVQLIGFNPQRRHVQSWDFSEDGGHAVGVWTPVDGGWQAKVVGMTGDGVSTSAVNVVKRIDDNAYTWQSIRRTLGDTPLPDTDEIVLRRSTTP